MEEPLHRRLCFKLIHALYKKARELDLPDADQLTPKTFSLLCDRDSSRFSTPSR